MKRWHFWALGLLLFVTTTLVTIALASQQSETAVLTLVTAVDVGGRPDTLVVDHYQGRHDIQYFDAASNKLRFLDGDTFQIQPEEIALPTWNSDHVLAYDRINKRTFAVSTRAQGSAPNTWYEAQVHVLGWRQELARVSVNASFNTGNVVDTRYFVDGFAFRQPGEEGDYPGRLILDNTPQGNIDVVDFNHIGTDLAQVQRYSYRQPVSTTGFYTNEGNTLGLETQHETLSVDDLTTTDQLYISDANQTNALPVLRLNHPAQVLGATALPSINLSDFNCGLGGCKGVAVVGARDQLYIATGNQKFETGYVNRVGTTNNQLQQSFEITYGDHNFVYADWADPSRLFVVTHDWYQSYDATGGLYLHLLDQGTAVASLRLMENYEDGFDTGLREMVFDPISRRLYLSIGPKIMVVDVNYGRAPLPLPSAPLAIATTTLGSPYYGGTLSAPDGSATLNFPPNWVSEQTEVTYAEEVAGPVGNLYGVRIFTVTAVPDNGLSTTSKAYAMTLNYTDFELGGAKEETLDLYWWNGSTWVPEPTANVKINNNEITAVPEHIGSFAILGETNLIYLPTILNP